MMYYFVNTETNEVLQRVERLDRRLEVAAIKRTVTPGKTGRLWDDAPFAVVEAMRDDDLPAGHVRTGTAATFDGTRVQLKAETRARTREEIAAHDATRARDQLAASDGKAARVLEDVIEALATAGQVLPAGATDWRADRVTLRKKLR